MRVSLFLIFKLQYQNKHSISRSDFRIYFYTNFFNNKITKERKHKKNKSIYAANAVDIVQSVVFVVVVADYSSI